MQKAKSEGVEVKISRQKLMVVVIVYLFYFYALFFFFTISMLCSVSRFSLSSISIIVNLVKNA